MDKSPNPFTPLKLPLFRDRWIASTVSSVGTWMQDTAGTWLMTAITSSPLLIALMQTAASLPVVILGLLAGATADIFDRRKLLIFWQIWMFGSVFILAILTFCGIISPATLLILTFALNIGSAMNNPAWQAIVPELVPREEIPNAVALNAASNNLARAVGPALGGLMVAAFATAGRGSAWVFLLNAASFAGVIYILVRWQRVPIYKSALPAERIAGSIRSGLRYIRYSPALQSSLARAFVFAFFVSAVWSLLAVVAAQDLHQGALGYGLLNGSLGLGAVLGATMLAHTRRHLKADSILTVASLMYVVCFLVLALVHRPAIIVPVLILSGFGWTSAMATLNVSVQLSVPAWVQARALGAYLTVFQGGLALGSVLWGLLAEHYSTKTALIVAAIGMVAALPLVSRFHILTGPPPDLTPYQWKRPLPKLESQPEPTDGPVRVSIDYRVRDGDYAEFTQAIHRMRDVRLRDGAMRWGIYRDATDPEHLNETFIMESWIDYLRVRERMTAADSEVWEHVKRLHAGEGLPLITHQLYAKEIARPTNS